MRCVFGYDGGGTKTDCVLMDETGAIVARARSGPSNAVNVGPEASANVLAESGLEALRLANGTPEEVGSILAGISGAGEHNLCHSIRFRLQTTFPKAMITVTSD